MHKINHSLLIGISGNEVKGMLNKYYQPQYLNEDIECVLPDKRYQQAEFTDVVARVSPDKNIHE